MGNLAKVNHAVGPKNPQLVILVGGTGDLAQRKLWPGLFHLVTSGFIPNCRFIGVSLDNIGVDDFRDLVKGALEKFSPRKATEATWAAFARTGKPDNPAIPHWPVYTVAERATLIFNQECRVANDSDRETRMLWKEIAHV